MKDFEITYKDDQLLLLLKESNEEAFTLIYRKFWDSLYSFAYKRLKDKDACKDVLQTVFTDLWCRKEKVNIHNLSAYLHSAVRFQVYKQVAKQPTNSEFFNVLEEILISPIKSDSGLLNEELSKMVDLWIAALPKKRRKIFLMHYYEDLSTDEIAKLLNISQKTVQNQLNTASTYIKARFAHFLSLAIIISFIYKNLN